MKLAAEKSLNRGICPVMNIKGKTVTYPFTLQLFQFCMCSGDSWRKADDGHGHYWDTFDSPSA